MVLSEQNLRDKLGRRPPWQPADAEGRRYASVAAIVRYQREPEVLLIRRSQIDGDPWSGHMALPGGRQDPDDADLLATAMRETREEVGIDLGRCAELVGRLDDLEAVARGLPVNLVIAPHVFVLAAPVTPTASSVEVDEILWAPLGPMYGGQVDATRPYELAGRRLELPAYRVGEQLVWGLTYRMLQMLFEVLRES